MPTMASKSQRHFKTVGIVLDQTPARTFRAAPGWFLWTSFFVWITQCYSKYSIEMDVISAFLHKPYYIQCTVTFIHNSSMSVPAVMFYHDHFGRCLLRNWHTCPVAIPHKSGDCGCVACHGQGQNGHTSYYRLFYYVDNVTLLIKDTIFRCNIEDAFFYKVNFKPMHIVEFTKKPSGDTIFSCLNSWVVFPWEFENPDFYFQSRVQILSYEWRFTHDVIKNNTLVAVFDNIQSKQVVLYNDISLIDDDGKQLKKLRINKLTGSHRGTMYIQVNFNATIYNTPWKPPPISDETLETDFAVGAHGSSMLGSNSRHSRDIAPHFQHILPTFLEDKVKIYITKPPEPAEIKFKAEEDLKLLVRVICYAKTPYYGDPPVNLTMFDRTEIIATRLQGHSILSKDRSLELGNFSCGLTGEAMACIPESDPRRQLHYMKKSDIHRQKYQPQALDYSLVLYVLETIVCFMLIFWVLSLMLDHVVILCRRQQESTIETQRRIKESKLQQIDLYTDIKFRRESRKWKAIQKSLAMEAVKSASLEVAAATPKTDEGDFEF